MVLIKGNADVSVVRTRTRFNQEKQLRLGVTLPTGLEAGSK